MSELGENWIWLVGLAATGALALLWDARRSTAGPRGRDAWPLVLVTGSAAAVIVIAIGVWFVVIDLIGAAILAFALGFGTLLILIRRLRRDASSGRGGRQAAAVGKTIVDASLLAGLLIVINAFAFTYGGRVWDLTQEGAFTLSAVSRQTIRALDRPTRFTLLFGEGRLAPRQRERVSQLLELYRAESPSRVTVRSINPYAEPAELERLIRAYPDLAVATSGVLVEYGEGDQTRHAVVRVTEIFPEEAGRFAGSANERFLMPFTGENALTSALTRLREGRRILAAVLTGHGEPSILAEDPNAPGLGLLAGRLRAAGLDVVEHDLNRAELPTETEIVMLVAPRSRLQPTESSRLEGFLKARGKALILSGPESRDAVAELLSQFNLEMAKDVIIDPVSNLQGRPGMILAFVTGRHPHPIVDPLFRVPMVLPRAAALTIKPPASLARTRRLPVAILDSMPDSWSESEPNASRVRFDPPNDLKGPFLVGVAVNETERENPERLEDPATAPINPGPRSKSANQAETRPMSTPRLVVFSSGLAGDNTTLQAHPVNADFLLDAVSWLRGNTDQLGISPATHETRALALPPEVRSRLVFLPTLLAILAIITAGLTVGWSRRDHAMHD